MPVTRPTLRGPPRAEGSGAAAASHKASIPSAAVLSAAIQQHVAKDLRILQPRRKPVAKPAPRVLTLAEQLGVFQAPPQIAQIDWERVHRSSRLRCDSQQPCAICHERFGFKQQVLLSCSHVFHGACIQNFEKFSGARTCPICRTSDYHRKVITDGEVWWRSRSVELVQAAIRGFLERRRYKKLRDTIPPKDPEGRKEFYWRKFEKTSSAFMDMLDEKDSSIDALFAELDNGISFSRYALGEVDTMMQEVADDLWIEAEAKARERHENECPICMSGLSHTKQTALLSCSHVFHDSCLASYEQYAAASSVPVNTGCPLCRSAYRKRTIRW